MGRNTSPTRVQLKNPKVSAKEYKAALQKAAEDANVHMEKNKELKEILTKHKDQLESSAMAIKEWKAILSQSVQALSSMMSTSVLFIEFSKQLQSFGKEVEQMHGLEQVKNEVERFTLKDTERITKVDLQMEDIQQLIDKSKEFLKLNDEESFNMFISKYSSSSATTWKEVYNEGYDLGKELGFGTQGTHRTGPINTHRSISHNDLKLVKENERLQKQIKDLKDNLK